MNLNTLPAHPRICPQCHSETMPLSTFCGICGFDLLYGKKRSLGKQICNFCGERSKITSEHIFGRHLGRRYPRKSIWREHVITRCARVVFDGSIIPDVGLASKARKQKPYDLQISNSCSTCNNGWMSGLQNEARNLVYSFADGYWPDLSDIDRAILSRWVIMTVMNLEDRSRIPTIPKEHRVDNQKGIVPRGWIVSVAQIARDDMAGESWHRAIFTHSLRGDGAIWSGNLTWFCIEKTLFHTFMLSDENGNSVDLMSNPHIQKKHRLREIWPTNGTHFNAFGAPLSTDEIFNLQLNYPLKAE